MIINTENNIQLVKENGYIKLPSILTNEEIVDLEKNCIKLLNESPEQYIHTETDFVKVISINQDSVQDNEAFGFLNKFFKNQELIEFVKKYFETDEINISKIFVAESSNSGEEVDVLPYKMHFDKTRYLKFMFYMRDIGPGDGAITFAKKEWNSKLQSELLKRDALKEENVVDINDESQIEELQGSAGTLVIFDTNVSHKAGQVLTDNKRLVIRVDTTDKIN